jgi:hypothetical protein
VSSGTVLSRKSQSPFLTNVFNNLIITAVSLTRLELCLAFFLPNASPLTNLKFSFDWRSPCLPIALMSALVCVLSYSRTAANVAFPVHTQGADHCLPHALKHRRLARGQELGQLITEPFGAEFLGASDLNSALCRLFSAIAQGLMSPKTAKPLVDLSRTMLKANPLAR